MVIFEINFVCVAGVEDLMVNFDDLDLVLRIENLVETNYSSLDLAIMAKVIFGRSINPEAMLRVFRSSFGFYFERLLRWMW